VGLAVLFAAGFVEALTEFAVLSFHLGQPANQTMVLPLEGLLFFGQHGQASAQVQDLVISVLTAWTSGTTRGHGNFPEEGCVEAGWSARCSSLRCTVIIGRQSRDGTNRDLSRPR
jgi:hypothetical protein